MSRILNSIPACRVFKSEIISYYSRCKADVVLPLSTSLLHRRVFSYALQRTTFIFFSDNAVIRNPGYRSVCIRNNNKTVNANADDADGGEMRMSDADDGAKEGRGGEVDGQVRCKWKLCSYIIVVEFMGQQWLSSYSLREITLPEGLQ